MNERIKLAIMVKVWQGRTMWALVNPIRMVNAGMAIHIANHAVNASPHSSLGILQYYLKLKFMTREYCTHLYNF